MMDFGEAFVQEPITTKISGKLFPILYIQSNFQKLPYAQISPILNPLGKGSVGSST
jgi:hypothetical protein